MEKMKNEKLIKRLIFLFGILFFVIAAKLTAQVHAIHRYTDAPNITTKIPAKSLRLINGNDTIFLGIMADSISPTLYEAKLFAHIPKNLKISNLLLGFQDQLTGNFKITRIDTTENLRNYVEYVGQGMANFLLQNRTLCYVYFEDVKQFFIMDNRKSYFYDFLMALN
jgi:hypothetical protein